MLRSIASAVPYLTSALVLSALVPACGANNNKTSGFQTGGSGNNGNGNGSGDNGGGITGGGGDNGGGLNLQDGGAGSFLDAGCAQATASATRQPVYLLFVLDGSGSMAWKSVKNQPDPNSRWNAATTALNAIFDDMKTSADPGLGVGLIAFSDSKDKSGPFQLGGGPYPGPNDVPIAFVSAAQNTNLKARIAGTPSNDTPTQAALTGAYGELEPFQGNSSNGLPPDGKKVVVLITDGVPTDCMTQGGGYSSNACITMAAAELAKASPQGPIETFVIGIGTLPSSDLTNYDPSFLGTLAQEGGSGPKGCNPTENTAGATDYCYFTIDPAAASNSTQFAQQFETAINNIRGQVASCTYPLQATDAGVIDPTKVNVTVNGQGILQDPANGWSYADPPADTTIQLNGTACNTVKNTPGATVNIVLGCATVVAK